MARRKTRPTTQVFIALAATIGLAVAAVFLFNWGWLTAWIVWVNAVTAGLVMLDAVREAMGKGRATSAAVPQVLSLAGGAPSLWLMERLFGLRRNTILAELIFHFLVVLYGVLLALAVVWLAFPRLWRLMF